MKSHNLVLLNLHVCALLFGGTVQFSKLLPLSAIDIMIYRTFLCTLALLAIALLWRQGLNIKSFKHFALLSLCSLLFAFHWVTYFHAMQISTIAVGLISMFTFPVITVFLEPLFQGRKPQVIDVLMGIAVLLGVSLLAPEFNLKNEMFLGVLFGLASAIAVAFRNVIISEYLRDYSPITIMFYHVLIGCLCLIPFLETGFSSIQSQTWLLLIIFAVIFTALPHTQITYGLRHISAKTMSMILSLQVVYAVGIAYLLLGETLSINTMIGGAIVIGASIIETVRSRPKKDNVAT